MRLLTHSGGIEVYELRRDLRRVFTLMDGPKDRKDPESTPPLPRMMHRCESWLVVASCSTTFLLLGLAIEEAAVP